MKLEDLIMKILKMRQIQDEEQLQNKKKSLHVTHDYVQRHLKLKSKISNDLEI